MFRAISDHYPPDRLVVTAGRASLVGLHGRRGSRVWRLLREWVGGEGATRTIQIGLGDGVPALFVCQGLLSNRDPSSPPATAQ